MFFMIHGENIRKWVGEREKRENFVVLLRKSDCAPKESFVGNFCQLQHFLDCFRGYRNYSHQSEAILDINS